MISIVIRYSPLHTARTIGAIAFAALLAGCATSELTPTSGIDTGTLPPSRVMLTDVERNATCVAIENDMKSQVARIRTLEVAAEAERKAAAPTLARTFSRMFGPADADNKSLNEMQKEEKRLAAFNDLLGEKGCSKLDLVALRRDGNLQQLNVAAPGVPVATGLDIQSIERGLLPRGY